jgi:Putative peptidoglycan binding domain
VRNPVITLLALTVFGQAASQAAECVSQDELPQLLDDVGVPVLGIAGVATPELVLKNELMVRSERLSRGGVDVFQLKKQFAGQEISEYHKVVKANVLIDGECMEQRFLRPMSQEEVMKVKMGDSYGATQEFMRQYAKWGFVLGDTMDRQMRSGGRSRVPDSAEQDPDLVIGMNMGLCQQVRDKAAEGRYDEVVTGQPLEPDHPYPFSFVTFMAGPSCMAAEVAQHMASYEPESDAASAARQAGGFEAAAVLMQLLASEAINGIEAYHLAARGLGITQSTGDGVTMTIDRAETWIGKDYLNRVKTRFEGVMTSDGESRNYFLELEQGDFRFVPDTVLYEPRREIIRMGGMLGPKERAQMAEAQQKMAEFEKQMAAMPENQRAMMERMMGPQLEQMRSLVDNGTFEMEFITTDVIVNPDLAAEAVLGPLSSEKDVVRVVQGRLKKLGYVPGNTDGILDKATVAAISKFEADMGMEVSGQATPQLAKILAVEVEKKK